jgi:hypothetical protein
MPLRLSKTGLIPLLLDLFALACITLACALAAVPIPMPMQTVQLEASMDCHEAFPEKPAGDRAPHQGHQAVCTTGCLAAPSIVTVSACDAFERGRAPQIAVKQLIGWEGPPAPPPPRGLVA